MDDVSELFRTQTYLLGAEIKERLEKMMCSTDVVTTVEGMINSRANHSLFDSLQTAYLQRKYFSEDFSDYHVLGLCKHDHSMYVVPKFKFDINWTQIQ